MKLSQACNLVLRVSLPQQNVPRRVPTGKLVPRSAFVLAGLGVGVSSFSLKQLLATKRPVITKLQ